MNELYNKNDNLKKNVWKNIDNHIIFANSLGEKLGYTEPEHWYKITTKHFKDNKGRGLLFYYNGSPIQFVKIVLKIIFPEYEWFEWKFNTAPQNFWQDINNHKLYADWLGKKLGYTEQEHWYCITKQIIENNYGSGLISNYYNGSPIKFLRGIYPDYKWLEWKLGMVSGFRQDINNCKLFADWLGKELGYTELEHWYNIKADIIIDNDGNGILQIYNNSPIQFVKAMFPEYEWLEWKFGMVSNGFWQNVDNRKLYTDWLGKELGYTEPEHWYCITKQIIENNYGSGGFIQYYNGSPIQFVKAMFPDYEWLEWKFGVVTTGFWQNTNNRKLFTDWLGKELGYTEPEHWYCITQQIVNNNDGCGLISHYYNGSPIQFVKAMFPDYEWLEWKFGFVSNGYWQDTNNHKLYADWLSKELGYTDPEHWYCITQKIINNNYGCGLISNYYNGSSIQFVKAMFPDYEWLEWKFGFVSNGYWQDTNNHKLYADWLGKKLGYTEPEHWYCITQKIINNNNGCGLSNYYNGSPSDFIISVYPEYEWDKTKFYQYKTEAKLYNLLITIYPTSIRQFTPEWVKPKRFDFCIPEYKIIIELDGRQHFQQVSNWSSPESQFENDKYKEKCANDNGYSVIRIIQEDVFDDTYDWFKELCDVIEEIKNNNDVSNVYFDRNEEYSGYHII